jgi:polar amino acid transport system substrate-binding protein
MTRLALAVYAGILWAFLVPLDVHSAEEKPAAGRKVLLVCAEPAAMPRTGKGPDDAPQGLDLAVARQLAQALGRKLEVHWCSSASCSWKCLDAGRCDVVLGQPHDSGPPREVAWSVPYAGGQFGLVVPSKDAKSVRALADLRGKRLGVVAGTVALSEKDHTIAAFKTREDLLNGFQAAHLHAAFMDADFAAWYLHDHPKLDLRLVADYVPRERWNLAMAVRAKDARLLVEINRALSELAESGDLKKVYAEYGVPYRSPFTDSARKTAAYDTWKRIRDRGELVIAMDPANLPYSSAKEDRPGFDVELARALAREMGIKLRLDWLDIHRETAMGKLLDRQCDLALGAAVDPNAFEDDDELADKVIYSRPYYGTGYLLVQRKDGPHVKALAELKGEKSQRLGTEAGTFADYNLRQRGYQRRLFRNQLAVLKSLDDGRIDYAYLWANVGWTLHTSPEFKLELVSGYVPEDHWNIAAAMRKGDDELKRHVDAALDKLVKDGTVARALVRYHVPHFPPFPEKEDKGKEAGGEVASPDGVIRHGVADRGREPQLQRVQTSKKPYGGLSRVRSAGVLIVGLDQNSLPFSAAHPKPAGLDYEIAGLLAEQLGLSLQVYWAYSSHDSYPSKLATKKLCDVILGIMPDDRFGRRVLYSKPYYIAGYQYVVRAGDSPPADEPLAIEQGVAVRGLGERAVQPFPDLDAVLEAVAAGKVKAGYVIAARSHWLAEQHWPGKLRFLDGTATDQFPICAAVRPNEGDLKEAIDQALDELARSGRLAKVFARWHIPYTVPTKREEPSK